MEKRIINLFIAALFMTSAAFAGTTPSISTDGTKTFVLDTKLWKSESLSVEIRDNEGIVIFEDNYKTTNNKKRFNFENLPNGSYTITLDNEFKTTKQEFVITSNEIKLLPNEVTTYKPVITIADDHIDLNYLSNNNFTAIDIYSNDENIFNVDLKEGNSIHKRFNTNELPKGDYTFTVASGGEIYSKRFSK
ncbi:MAG: T9SS type A sorting domain-containing protein [Bacteroidota bacterium]